MTVVLRALGLHAAYAVLQTFSPRAARAASLMLLLTANAMPLLALLSGRWAAGDVLIAFWLENVAIGLWTAVRIATASGDVTDADLSRGRGPQPFDAWTTAMRTVARESGDPRAAQVVSLVARLVLVGFFAVHYGGFTLVHGIFTFTLARDAGTTGSVGGYLLLLLVLLGSHGLSTAIWWFARGERHQVGPQRAMVGVYSRVLVMHLSVIGAGWFLVGGGADQRLLWPGLAVLGPGLLLIAIKVVVDVAAHLRQHRGAQPVPAAVPEWVR
jgi:hypothetical protein